MDFNWSAEQTELYEHVLKFARQGLGSPDSDGFERARWSRCGELGLAGLSGPRTHGGLGLDALSTAHALEAFGRGAHDTGLGFALAAHLFACLMPISEWASDELKDRVLRELCSGRWIGANAITEAEAGSDVFALKASAKRDDDHYILSGTKNFVTNGPQADLFIVYASTNPKHGYMGLSAFVVHRDTPGLVIGKNQEKIGLSTSSIGSIYLEDVRVSATDRVGAEGQGALIFNGSMVWERACLFALYVGQMDAQLDQTIDYARSRKQFGKTIGSHQAVSHRIADMKVRLESARLLLYRACWLHTQNRSTPLDIAMSKLAVSEAAVQSGLDAIRVHGGLGVLQEGGIEAGLRDAIPSTLFSGTSDIQRNLIARGLGL